ncbi:DUF4136 domain-containing protein [Pseudomonas panipatensis]|uniref:DUF4136 domain-containing protein n=1 Tax=Pseudomonas panipatensis TaxID=428992 RepID=A0A1G8HF95_9PSED|nr:DUF4136 domain-containing protein [Pseudomonas panipatensis]SDI05279.1 protein of unknown function [Pseudomonas panipatensis]SMP57886.1 protein of unknown function [Pseudomonas panipatensis]
MIRRLLLLGLLLGLAACETVNLNRDYDSSRDFAAYRSWNWAQPAFEYRPDDPRIKSDLTEQRIRDAIADQLEQRGLRQAQGSAKGDVQVRAYLIVDQRLDQVTTYSGGYWAGYGAGYWGGPAIAESRTLSYKVATIQVDMLDGKDGRLVWRGSGEQVMNNSTPSPAEREAQVRDVVKKILTLYPPH